MTIRQIIEKYTKTEFLAVGIALFVWGARQLGVDFSEQDVVVAADAGKEAIDRILEITAQIQAAKESSGGDYNGLVLAGMYALFRTYRKDRMTVMESKGKLPN